jgi:hypothetical protein
MRTPKNTPPASKNKLAAPFSPEEAVALLLQIHPKGFRVDQGGNLSAAGSEPDGRSSEKITSLDRLSELARAPKTLQIEIHGCLVEIAVKGLSGEEDAEADKVLSEVGPPPKKYKIEQGKKVEDGFDYNDKEWVGKRVEALRLKRARVISMGLSDLEVPGDTLEAKADWLSKNFPPHVLDALHAAIANLTTEPIERAAFI